MNYVWITYWFYTFKYSAYEYCSVFQYLIGCYPRLRPPPPPLSVLIGAPAASPLLTLQPCSSLSWTGRLFHTDNMLGTLCTLITALTCKIMQPNLIYGPCTRFMFEMWSNYDPNLLFQQMSPVIKQSHRHLQCWQQTRWRQPFSTVTFLDMKDNLLTGINRFLQESLSLC